MKETFREYVASRLRELRANKRYTIKELSILAGVSKDVIWRYENNKASMQIDMLKRILDVYSVSLPIFFEEILAKTQKSKEE